MRFIFIILFAISLIHAHSYFRKVGWINPSPSFGHVHFTIDLSKIEHHVENMIIHLEHFSLQLHIIPHTSVKHRAYSFFKNSLHDIHNLKTKFEDYLSVMKQMPHEQKRVKRFLGLLMAITSLNNSIFNTAEILHLKSSLSDVVTRQHHITDILQQHEVSIHNVQHDLSVIKEQFLKTVNIIDELTAMSSIHEAELQISRALDELHRMIDCITSGTERLFTHRLPICFTNMSNMEAAHFRLIHNAKLSGLEPVPNSVAYYFQMETSFILDSGLLHIFVHVPLSDYSRNLELMEFYSVPIALTSTLHMEFGTEQKYLAVGTGALHSDGLHAMVHGATLDKCLRFSGIYFCDTPMILSKHLRTSCLGAIYSQNFTHLEKKCRVGFFNAEEFIDPISANEFMIYTHKPQTIQVTCKMGRKKHIAVQTSHLLKLEQGCAVSTDHHLFSTGFDVNIKEEIQQWPMVWNISQTLFDLEPSKLESIIEELKLIDNKPIPIRDIKKMIWMNKHSTTNIGLTIVISVISLCLLSVMAFLGWRYYKIKMSQQINNSA